MKLDQNISSKILNKEGNVWYDHKRNTGKWGVEIKRNLDLLESLHINFSDSPKPPFWVYNDPYLFGAYLAGVIDGDIDIRIKRSNYPQCVIRITSGSSQVILGKTIMKILVVVFLFQKDKEKANLGNRQYLESGMNWNFMFLKRILNILIIT